MTKKLILLITLLISVSINAQNIFPKKLENCKTDRFCLDCGDVKTNVDQTKFNILIEKLNSSNNLYGIKGKVKFQVLVDSLGQACVLSHTDVSENIITKNIVVALNNFDGYIVAKTKDKNEQKTSFNLSFEIDNGKMNGKVERVDIESFEKSFDKPTKPEVYNKDYTYKNKNLKKYKFSIWNSENSSLSDNSIDNFSFDNDNNLWIIANKDVQKFNGQNFEKIEKNETDDKNFSSYFAICTDNNNVKWFDGLKSIYNYSDKWSKLDQSEIGIDGAYDIINNKKNNELFFCSDKGLTIYKNGEWNTLNKEKLPELPSNRVYFAKRDSKNRIWIGTFSGTLMIDENGKATNFENTETILKGQCITSMDEDEKGNLYFSLFEFDLKKNPGKINKNEGIGILNSDGKWQQLTTSNSGLPYNHTNCVLYDKKEKVLWISTDRAGLVRYDLKDSWENYHNENSKIPTSYISTMAFDKDGNLFLATRQGIVKIEKK
ncbi:two-component regulator propeller domain-containing protein [Flavobacterium sp.]|uniref:ligand-binding sensor domain-containing protein n=1 Tax=Flavobacterium sp. TaxID=239 RepID=UPI0026340A0C|nr:two-component regulator propeller domain-containing protein [Flavobacterium sp.]